MNLRSAEPATAFPGWVVEETQRNGKTKRIYVDQRAEVARRAGEYLLGARTGGEIVTGSWH